MPTYLNALVMLVATLAAFVLLARLANRMRTGRLAPSWARRARAGLAPERRLLAVEEAVAVDGRRRLVAVRCGNERIVILTGGPADLVVAKGTLGPAQGEPA